MLPSSRYPTQSKEAEGLAVQCFRVLLTFMGHIKSPTTQSVATQPELTRHLLAVAIGVPELRDELLCQAVKQLSAPPSPDCARQVWVLLYVYF